MMKVGHLEGGAYHVTHLQASNARPAVGQGGIVSPTYVAQTQHEHW